MKKHGLVLYIWWLYIKCLPTKMKHRLWNKHILLWWYKLWLRKDEFSRSLDIDIKAMFEMNEKEKAKYIKDLMHRRDLAHERNLNSS